MLRRQLPAYSPLPLSAVGAAVAGKLGGGRRAEDRVRALLERHYHPKNALLSASGTTALEMAMAGAVAVKGGAVALPAYSCFDLATAAVGARVPVVLYDVCPRTLSPDAVSLRQAVEMGAQTIVVAHLYGVPADLAVVSQIAEQTEAMVIEDCAQAVGATYDGRPLGAFGSLTILSFGRGKGVTAGAGGALLAIDTTGVTAMDAIPRNGDGDGAYSWLQIGALAAQWVFGRPWLYGVPSAIPALRLGETVYHAPVPRRGLGPPGCLALAKTWPLADREVTLRRTHATRVIDRLEQASLTAVRGPAEGAPSYLRLPVVMHAADRPRASSPRARTLGIMPGYPKPLSDLDGFPSRCWNGTSEFPGARLLSNQLITIPTHSRLRERDLQKIEAWIDDGASGFVGDR